VVNIGDVVEVALNRATDAEIARQRPGTYKLEPDVGRVLGAPFEDDYGVSYTMVQVGRSRRRIETRKLTVVDPSRLDEGWPQSMYSQETGEPKAPSPARHFGEAL